MSEPTRERDDGRTIGFCVSRQMRAAIEELIEGEYSTLSEYLRGLVREDLKRRGKLRDIEPAAVATAD